MKKISTKLANLSLFDRILILLAILGVVFFAYVFFRKTTFITVVVKVGEDNILYEPWRFKTGTHAWFAQLFHVGMKEVDGLGRVGAEVLSVRSYDTLPSRKAVYLTVKLRVVYNRASNQYNFKATPLLIGAPVRLNLDKLLVKGLVTNVEGAVDPREKVGLLVEAQIREETEVFPETSGTKEYVANAIKVGDEIKDDQGNVLVRVLEKRIENAKRFTTTSSGQGVVSINPLRKDVYLTLEVNAFMINDRYFLFDDVPLLIGENIPLNTPTISVGPEVTKITLPE